MNAPNIPRAHLAPRPFMQRRAQPWLGTLVEIAAQGESESSAQNAISTAFKQIARVHALMSYHDPISDVSRINREAHARAVVVHRHTWQVLKTAQQVAEFSGGLFDITVAPALTRLGYLPRHPDFPRISGQGDWQHVELLSKRRVRLARKLRVDLSGIAKGYAVDLAIATLRQAGVVAGRVNAGGDLRLFGPTSQTLYVRDPHSPTHTLALMDLTEAAAATSAAYFSRRRAAGRTLTPLIHPHTRTSCGAQRSVTVVARSCMQADALTKVVHADPARALSVLQRFEARALLLEHNSVTQGSRVFDSQGQNGRWAAHWGIGLPI